ncbi:MAG: NTP transferase domain-containing protein, partial [Candidatus Thorarchaeota archaeon]|nr:NTP transferase domain-containing protein [Candidatus Thorarchaeota archaeon]
MKTDSGVLGQRKTMCALVLAAGQGSRMSEETLKQLHPVAGLPLLERALCSLRDAGIVEVHVVVGCEGDRIQQQIGTDYAGLNMQ